MCKHETKGYEEQSVTTLGLRYNIPERALLFSWHWPNVFISFMNSWTVHNPEAENTTAL
jgi:hypothetical protein